tara:strand:+ start:427 stop:1422 length:996 start_codon:yes stop_codon:yes gene_type:complete
MEIHKRIAITLVLMYFIPTLISTVIIPNEIISPVSAASCKSSNREPIWDLEAANISVDNYYGYYKEMDEGSSNGNQPPQNEMDDEDLMYYKNPSTVRSLGTLTGNDDFSTSQVLKNDSISGLRLNLTTGQKYTFCITAQHLNNQTIIGNSNVDVYLLTEYDWDIYERDYNERYSEWRAWQEDVPIEWRTYMSSLYWKPFRDIHEYTEQSSFEFSVALDQPLVTNTMWQDSGPSWEEFYLVVDGWDNIYDDAGAPGHQVQVDIQVMIEERTALPNWTVSVTCCGLFLAVAAIPAILHVRYQKTGLTNENKQLIPKVSGTDSKTFGSMRDENE